MKRRRIIIVLAVVLLAVGLFWLLHVSPQAPIAGSATMPAATPRTAQAQSSPIAEAKRFKEASALVERIFSAPIEFYGRVIDQNGDPVPYANVGYTAADKFNASGSNYTGQSDEKGNFNIKGIKGAGLAVTVRKVGYYLIHNPGDRSLPTSTATFAFGMGPDSYRRPAPSKDKPAVFVLHKMGKPASLIYVGTRYYKVSKDGQPLEVKLETGGQVPVGQGDIRFERWANDHEKNQRGQFDWRFRITVPGGGVVEREGQFNFQAPQDGYEKDVEINMPVSPGGNWSNTVNKSYFIKMRDGRYARFSATILAANDNPAFKLDAFVNPTPGDRNLEFDPEKAIKP